MNETLKSETIVEVLINIHRNEAGIHHFGDRINLKNLDRQMGNIVRCLILTNVEKRLNFKGWGICDYNFEGLMESLVI